ncbi:protein-glutamate methylesterase/protein-glutamine glutaminase [Jeotgalibaca caeni]|uniref:protein-glutamate methylesterase/protein-glutamine glutaminase n=1 Tax=Jeotgalibaca caeni TaxID=3028623 RepID=UPI00237E9B66|nr:chemotaxis response regulator protein-glutamate methylesterase [Jeotgalibaca caeni]MDE1548305.1 chemotaxis response regulator protein-glutamate methylesterase [Jeotgalibaca caeni]
MNKRILVVDDSAFMRKVLTQQISAVHGYEVAGTARSGEDALKKMELVKPDAVTLDVEMPGMGGLETLTHIKKQYDIPVFMLSSLQGKEITIQALEAGATDFIEKPSNLLENAADFQERLEAHLSILLDNKRVVSPYPLPIKQEKMSMKKIKAIVIGASTGGPRALLQVIRSLPSELQIPVFITQHMPEGFTTSFAKRLDDSARIPVKEAEHGELIQPGTVYVAPGNYHMAIKGDRIYLDQTEKLNGVRPAVDVLFDSASQVYKENLLAVILTGMGKDGTKGMKSVKKLGGHTLAQDEASSVVYGMPGNAVRAGVVDRCADLVEIADILKEVAKVSK